MTFTRCIPRLPSQAIYLLEARHLKCTEESDLFSESIENRQRTLPSFAQAIMLLCLYSPFSVSVQTISSSSLLAFSRVPPIPLLTHFPLHHVRKLHLETKMREPLSSDGTDHVRAH